MISWFNRKKTSIALSTAEVEYIAACSACSEAIWLRNMLAGLFDEEIYVTDILYDNQSCINMIENPVFHDKTNHIEVRYHFIRDMVQKGFVNIKYVSTKEQVADMLTKPLDCVKFDTFETSLV